MQQDSLASWIPCSFHESVCCSVFTCLCMLAVVIMFKRRCYLPPAISCSLPTWTFYARWLSTSFAWLMKLCSELVLAEIFDLWSQPKFEVCLTQTSVIAPEKVSTQKNGVCEFHSLLCSKFKKNCPFVLHLYTFSCLSVMVTQSAGSRWKQWRKVLMLMVQYAR